MKFELVIQMSGLIFTGVIQGTSGFGFGLLAVGLLVTFYSPKVVIPTLLIIYLITTCILASFCLPKSFENTPKIKIK